MMFGTSRIPPNPAALAAAAAGATEPPLHFNLVIRKAAGVSLGIDVAYSSSASWTRNGICVARILDDGIVATWNARSEEPRRVHPGDFIFSVNNIHGDTIAMIQEIKVKQLLTIHVMRLQAPEFSEHFAGDDSIARLGDLDSVINRFPPRELQEIPEPEGHDSIMPQPEEEQMVEQIEEAPEPEANGRAQQAPPGVAPPLGPDGNRRFSPRVEALLPQLAALSNEALASLICVALESRPWQRDAILRMP